MWSTHRIYARSLLQVRLCYSLNKSNNDSFVFYGLGVLLYSLLADPRLRHTKILLVLTKMDLAYRQMRNEALLILQIEKLKKEITQSITIVETDSISCNNFEKIIDWLRIS